MTIKEAKRWIKAFKEARFKCIAPGQIIEAMRVLRDEKTDQGGDK